MERWTADRIADQTGRTFVVTGANSGLGFETARRLAAHGGRVVLTARTDAKGADAVSRIKAAHPGATACSTSRTRTRYADSPKGWRMTGSPWTCW
jgi:NAD(P)-dependent dehydrogenase (short-subunit alcohol dehydrogenase family)